MMNSAGRGAKAEVMPSALKARASAPKGLSERSTFFGLCLIGKMVSVQTTDGSSYKGLFFGMKETESGDRHMVLSHATKDDQKDTMPYAIIPHSVFASLSAEEIDLAGQDIAAKPFHATSRFEDSNIANDSGNVRQLQAFVFDGADTSVGLEETQGTAANGWSGNDMFAENERRFGITATFEESMYTTAIENANISPEEAQRIADSILAQNAATAHEREERGIIDDSGLSEEDKYGAVLRQVPAVPEKGGAEGADEASATPSRPAWDSPTSGVPAALAPPGSAPAPDNAALDASSERVEINAVRRKIAEGKSLKTAVPAELRTKYVNNASEVDALNLMPGSGSNKFRKDKVSNVAQSLDDFKTKRFSGSNPASISSAAVAATAGNEGDSKRIPPADGAPESGAASAAASPFKMNPDAKPFSFNPKSAPFVPGAKKPSDSASTGAPEFGSHHGGGRGKGHRERGDGIRGARVGRSGRNSDGYGPQGGMYRPPAQGAYMYGGAPVNMVVPQGMQRGGPRHGGGMPQMQYPNTGMVFAAPYPFVQGNGMMPAMSMAPGPMMQHAVPGFPQSAAQSPPSGGGYMNKQG